MRFIKDALHKCGETTKLDYSCELLTECKQSHSPYIADIKKKKQIEEAEKANKKIIDQLYSDGKNELECIEELVSKEVYEKYKQVLEPVRTFIVSLMDQIQMPLSVRQLSVVLSSLVLYLDETKR